jgi:hypothetical protein
MKTLLSLILASALFAADAPKPDAKDAEIAKLKAQVVQLRTALVTQIQASNAKDYEINDLRKTYFDHLNEPITKANDAAKTAQTDYEKKLADFCAVKPDGEDCPKKTP